MARPLERFCENYRMRTFLICSVLVYAFGISISCQSGLPPPELTNQSGLQLSDLSEDDQIREAIFRSAGLSRMEKVSADNSFYLAVNDDQDPSDNLMDYLNNGGSFLKKVSQSYIDMNDVGVVRDKFTNHKGTRFAISHLTRQGSDKVKVSAGKYRGNMESERCFYTLTNENDEWKIILKEGCVVS